MSELICFIIGMVIGWFLSPPRKTDDRTAFIRGQIFEAKDPERIRYLREIQRRIEDD